MSINVELADLPEVLGQVPGVAFFLTVNGDQTPHPANVNVTVSEASESEPGQALTLVVSAGRRSCANAAERANVTLLWANKGARAMSLLVDGVATVESSDDGVVRIAPTSAIWHRHPDVPTG